MKILVTGASGFVGTHLVSDLLKGGHHVYALVRNPAKFSHPPHPKLELLVGDLGLRQLNWMDTLPQDLDACVHTAGIVHSYYSEEFDLINHQASKSLIELLKAKYPQTFKFILISSLAAAGPSDLGEKKSEEQPDLPISFYGLSKKKAEEALSSLAPKEWVTSIVRPPMVIGPGDVAILDIYKMVRDGFILLPGIDSRMKLYSFVCVFDLVESIKLTLNHPHSIKIYSAHEQVVSFQEIIFEIKSQMNKKWHLFLPVPFFIIRLLAYSLWLWHKVFSHQLRLTPDKIKELGAAGWTCDSKRSQTLLSQKYRFDFKETIAVTLADYRQRKWL